MCVYVGYGCEINCGAFLSPTFILLVQLYHYYDSLDYNRQTEESIWQDGRPRSGDSS